MTHQGPWPFNDGDWAKFVEEFKAQFGASNEAADARREIDRMKLKKGQKVADYTSHYQEIAERTGYSDLDLWERYASSLSSEIRMHLMPMEIGQGKPADLAEMVR